MAHNAQVGITGSISLKFDESTVLTFAWYLKSQNQLWWDGSASD